MPDVSTESKVAIEQFVKNKNSKKNGTRLRIKLVCIRSNRICVNSVIYSEPVV